MRGYFIYVILVSFLIQSCRKETLERYEPEKPILPEELYDYESFVYPEHILNDPLMGFFLTFPVQNPITNEGAMLGRVLFYDKKMSLNNTISCSSCHLQSLGFTDGEKFSEGFEGGLTDRNSMSILNMEFQRGFFWDVREDTLEAQVLKPIQHPIEMGMELEDLEKRLSLTDYYPALFELAFGDQQITAGRIGIALGQFIRSIRSYRSKYDVGAQSDFSNFTADEFAGKEIFFKGGHGCNNCHFSQNFGGVTANINGVVRADDPGDQGVWDLSGNDKDLGRFKSVSLRNIMLTAPYMHDGRFETIDEVIDYYSEGINAHPYLDDRLTTDFQRGGPPKILGFTEEEKKQLKAFFHTLTDYELINDPRFSDPFVK